MRRFGSLFVFSLFLFVMIANAGFGTSQINNNNKNIETNTIFATQEIDHYTSYTELCTILQDLSNNYENIIELYNDRGRTYEDRTIWVLKISDNPEIDENDETEVLYVGAHHGDEAIGNEMALFIIKTLTAGYGSDPRITWLVDNHEIWVVPMPNPDGLEYTLNVEAWRKNRSPNYISEVTPNPLNPKIYPTSYGTDLNRNYDMEWGDPGGSSVLLQRSSTYAGSEPFSELETQTVRDLVLAHEFSVYMDYHSGTEMILYPWGYTSDPTPDNVLFERVAEKLSALTGYEARQGYDLYQTNGDAVDWVYSASRALSFTVELSHEKMPDPGTIQPYLDNNIKQPLYLTGISANLEAGSQIEILHENIGNQSDLGPYEISAFITGIPQITNLEVNLYYKINNNGYEIVTMKNIAEHPTQYRAEIPTQGPDTMVYYFIAVTDENIMACSPDLGYEFEFSIKPLPESITTNDEIIAMIIMMTIILGFFWGGFAYTARKALLAERRKLHDYYYSDSSTGSNYSETRTGY